MSRNKLQDGDLLFPVGQDSSIEPTILSPGAYARALNTVNRGGIIQSRPGYRCMTVLPQGQLQGAAVFRPKQGSETIIFGVAGLVYSSQFPFRSYSPVSGLQFSATAKRLYFKQVEQTASRNDDGSIELIEPRNLLVIQDGGFSTPGIFDGTRGEHQRGAGRIPIGGPMEWVGDRLWVARGSSVYASDIGNPVSFTEPIYIAGVPFFVFIDEVTALAKTLTSDFAQLLVFTATTTSVLQANIRDRALWVSTAGFQKELFPDIGCVSESSIVRHHGLLWWYSAHGYTSLDAAAQGFVSSSFPYQDEEMADSKSRLSSDLSGIAAVSHENYILVSVPYCDTKNRHTWCLDHSTFKKSDNRKPAWNGVWTGTRPSAWLSDQFHGEGRCFFVSPDFDGENRLWEAFIGDRRDDGCPITSYAELRGLVFDSPGKLKDFRYADLFFTEISGVVDVAVFWAGAHRGKYKRILTKRIVASRGTLRMDTRVSMGRNMFALKKQSRSLRTQDAKAIIAEETLSSCEVEAPELEFKDDSFQLLVVWSGVAALRGFIAYAEPPTNVDDTGRCEEDEDEENLVRFDGAASEASEIEAGITQFQLAVPTFTATAVETVTKDGITEIGIGTTVSVISQKNADTVAATIARRTASQRLSAELPQIVSLGEVANQV